MPVVDENAEFVIVEDVAMLKVLVIVVILEIILENEGIAPNAQAPKQEINVHVLSRTFMLAACRKVIGIARMEAIQ